jgi:hypothetical protein
MIFGWVGASCIASRSRIVTEYREWVKEAECRCMMASDVHRRLAQGPSISAHIVAAQKERLRSLEPSGGSVL